MRQDGEEHGRADKRMCWAHSPSIASYALLMGKWESCSVNTACLKLTSCIIFFLLRAFSFQVSLFLFPKIHCPTAFSPFQPGLHSLSLPLLLPVFPHTALVLASPLLSSPLDTSFPHHSLFCRVSLSPEEITKQNCLRGKAQRTQEGYLYRQKSPLVLICCRQTVAEDKLYRKM